LYAYTLIATWQRLVSLNISWDFDILGKVRRKRGKFTVDDPSADDRRTDDICLTLITPKPMPTNQSQMSPAGVVNRRCRITVFIGFWNLG
jgi:hypothetical protein